MADAASWLGGEDFRLVIDDRELDARLRPSLEGLGWERRDVNVYLCHVGGPPSDREDVTLARASTDEQLAEWVRRRSLGFGDTGWAQASTSDVAAAVRQRRLQEGDDPEFFLVDRSDAAAGVVARYCGPDRLVFNLAVLPDQRSRGVGAAVMARAVAGAQRSALVNTDEAHGPVELYRQWGFIDEVYRRITYRRKAS